MTNYSRGANYERRVIKYLRSQGMRAHRTAGSHTPIDIMAGADGKSFGIQCQLDKYFLPAKIEALKDECREFGCVAMICYNDKGKICMEGIE